MKYTAVLNSDIKFTDEVIAELKNTAFSGDDPNYRFEMIEIKEHKVAHWVEHEKYYDCSRCSCLAPCTEFADGIVWKLSKYCPDCGSEMKGGENGN